MFIRLRWECRRLMMLRFLYRGGALLEGQHGGGLGRQQRSA